MLKSSWFVVLSLALWFPGHVDGRDPQPVTSLGEVQQLLDELVERSFPELAEGRIKLRTFKSESVYFRSRPTIGSFLFSKRLTYLIDVNPRVFELEPPREAVVAILAHELSHSSHYTRSSRWRVVGDLRQFVCSQHMVRFERRTDLDAIDRGYHAGLAQYREWIYAELTPKALAKKRRDYLTPEEIHLVERVRHDHPDLMAEWRREPPRDLAAFEASLAAHLATHPAPTGLAQGLTR
jgi:hypothetical protein